MASVKVAVRVRPLNQREHNLESEFIIQMDGKKTSITNTKGGQMSSVMSSQSGSSNFGKELTKDFTYDYSYWSVDSNDERYDAQEQVFNDLGTDVISSAYEGYNACVFAYGQTGSGKTYTMMGSLQDPGLIPRICQELYARMTDPNITYRTEVSYLEIYNEKVRDLLVGSKKQHSLRVREHPKEGPYVQDLSKHIVVNYTDILELMNRGNTNRTTAATGMNDVSSRSHAIFTMTFTQAQFSQDAPSEKHSKIHLVDLAGSERADATGSTGQRLKEGGSINKSLVTLGKIISTLADMSEQRKSRKSVFIPYRDSVLTWLLKDSLGGNAKTIMIATISPADCNYAETLSTLRYANRAKNIINKPTVNEDANVRLIRDLREEISRLKAMLGGKSDKITTPRVQEKLHENEARVKVLTEEWTGKWKELAHILQEEKTLALRKEGLGVVLDSELPHLIGIDDDILSTGIMLYHLKEGKTTLGTSAAVQKADIVLQGEAVQEEHCAIEHHGGQVTLIPADKALCTVNGVNVTDPVVLSQGAVILLGKTNMFRFNHPAQAAKLRKEFKGTAVSLTRISSLSQSMTDLARSTENLALITSGWEMEQRHQEQLEALEQKRQQIEELEEEHRSAEAVRIREQEAQEIALEEKRQHLTDMVNKSNQMKQEAEMMRKQMMEEAEQLKRRSIDVERQYAFFMQKKSELEEQVQSAESEKQKLKQQVEAEVRTLTEQEKVAVEQARAKKEKLQQEARELQESYTSRKTKLDSEMADLDRRIAQRKGDLEKVELNLEEQWRHLQARREKEQEVLERQSHLLEDMRNDRDIFYAHASRLDARAHERLSAEHDRLRDEVEEVRERERLLYAEYEVEREAIEARKKAGKEKVEQTEAQLEADKVYLKECVARVQEAESLGQSLSEEERDQLERERIAIETERERIKEDEEKLAALRTKVEKDYQTEMSALQEQRDEQVESLVYDKEKLKELEALRVEVVNQEICRSRQELCELRAALEDKEKELEEQEANQKQSRAEVELEVTSLEHQRETLLNELVKLEEDTLGARAELEEQRLALEEALQKDMRNAETRRKMLDDLETRQLRAAETETEVEEEKLQFEHYQKLKQSALLEQEHHLAELRTQDRTLLDKERRELQSANTEFTQKMKDLEKLEEQLRLSEAELEENRQRLERERQEELDRIDMEKFTLQEMEDQERINALVEQEVKRRLFEERVQREKQRRMEREREKVEREKELSKIKRAHDREIQRLREKYETSNTNINANAPTKANPYANIMTAERGSSRRDGSLDGSLRAQSMSVVQLTDNTIEVSIPGYVQRGSSLDTHYEFEVKLTAGADAWVVYRRYSRFRDLHHDLKSKYPQIAALVFPPKRWFSNRSEKVVAERRKLLEDYLRSIIQVLQRNPACTLHPSRQKLYSKQVLHEFHPFFKKGIFETSKHGTG